MPYSSWTASTQPKVQGTLNLHRALKQSPLDFFVMTSSVSGILGTPGQSNYAAANSFLNSLARHRQRQGQKASSLILTMVLGIGYVAEHAELEETIKSKGIYGIDEEHMLSAFDVSMLTQKNEGSADHIVLGMDPAKIYKSLSEISATDAFWINNARFKMLAYITKSAGNSTTGGSGKTILTNITSAKTPEEAIQVTKECFTEKLSRLLGLDMSDFEPDVKTIASYGLDSMIGAELRNWIFKELGLDIPFQQLLGDSLTISKFATQVCANQDILVEQ